MPHNIDTMMGFLRTEPSIGLNSAESVVTGELLGMEEDAKDGPFL